MGPERLQFWRIWPEIQRQNYIRKDKSGGLSLPFLFSSESFDFFPPQLSKIFSLSPPPPSPSVRRQNMKVRINATGDTIVMKFVRPSPDVKLEGYILGYGSSMFSKQFIQLPENGQPYETEMGTETRVALKTSLQHFSEALEDSQCSSGTS